jgi:phosphoenolpyruvate-protein kinase (PTS system EI component)
MDGRPVVFRTLDIGGDKPADYASGGDDSSALGVRGIRLGLRRPELLQTQLRALLEASPDVPLRILLPMVGTLEEVAAVREALDRAAVASRASNAPIASDVRLGVMIEVPSAALMADEFATVVDFFSIGTNDLVQYTLAADRTNPALTELASTLQPAVLRLIASVIRAADAAGCPVSVCGEAASDPLAGPLLVGLGVKRLSVAPQSIASVRSRLATLGLAACEAAAGAALGASTVADVTAIARTQLPMP